jgi:integrase
VTIYNVCSKDTARSKKMSEFKSYTMWAFSEDELKRLLASCTDSSDYIMILLSSRYGFRRDDVVNLRIKNVDFVNSTLTFYEKKKSADRTIPIESDVAIELKRYFGSLPKNAIYMLPFRDGTTAWRHLQDVCLAASIPIPVGRTGRPFHSLRGTCVKLRQKQGWTLNQVAALINDDVDTVAKHYATTTLSELSELMKQ